MRMFRVDVDGKPAGYAGWWEEVHDGMPVYEVGCSIDPDWQGRGIASTALRETLRLAAVLGDRPLVVGYAHVDNAASNALCARVGFDARGHRGVSARGRRARNVGERLDDRRDRLTDRQARPTEWTGA